MELRVNGMTVRVAADEETPLLFVLREDLGLTGCKPGCGEGECGACTVLIQDEGRDDEGREGKAVRSCITEAGRAVGREVLTIEGLAIDGELHPLQQAFLDHGAFQCGYCTPGMIMSALALLIACPDPTEADIVEGMQGNICRCGAYLRIVRAIRQAGMSMRSGSPRTGRAAR
jgi:aerobic-type carbon monoxide dehydrogenase small subunit (CoxS/CutS family)